MPKASIIIPAFNSQDYIAETIESILQQSFSDFEIIIVDDGSTDGTADVIATFDDTRIHYFHQPNSGRPASPRNKAIRASSGEYIFIFDSDDLMVVDKVGKTLEAFSLAPEAGLAFTGFDCIDESGNTVNPDFLAPYSTLHNLPKQRVSDDAWLIESRVALKGLASSNYLGTSGVAIRRDVFEQVGYFDEDVRNADDSIMWQAVATRFNFLYLPAIYHHYRVRSGSISLRKIEDRAPGIITAITKMKRFHEHDPESQRILDRKISRYYHDMGYSYFTQYKLADAREAFRNSINIESTSSARFYLVLSYLPEQIIRLLKRLKPNKAA